jgi:hypothetical protein
VLGRLPAHGLIGMASPKAMGWPSRRVLSGSQEHATHAVTTLQSHVAARLAVAPAVGCWWRKLEEGKMEVPSKVRVAGTHRGDVAPMRR